jgi:anti-sigma factor RsiW
MRAQGTSGAAPPGSPDREMWRRSREIEAPLDEAEWLMDLAAFADNRLDDDETARVAALIARDADAAANIAAARMLPDGLMAAAEESIIVRAAALVGEGRPEAVLVAFPLRQSVAPPWYSAATWSGLAAAIAIAGWLGFDLGSGLSSTSLFGHQGDETSASELLDPGPLMLRDFTENSQI